MGRFTTSVILLALGCGGGGGGDGGEDDDGPPIDLPQPACMAAASGTTTVAAPSLKYTLKDRWQEAWLASPAVLDLDGDGTVEIVAPRHELLLVWRIGAGGEVSEAWRATLPARIWASPVIGDFDAAPGLEVAVASENQIAMFTATGTAVTGFPFAWRRELRSLAAGDVDGNGQLDLVAVTTTPLDANNQRDIVIAVDGNGEPLPGFPANTTGAAGCDDQCYVTGGYDENLALGDVDGDGTQDIFATQDNAYMSLHDGSGRAFDAAPIFDRAKFSGIRWMLDYALAQQGYSDNSSDLQAHFTNSAPAIADLDGDRTGELISLGSVQNVAQNEREQGVVLFVARHDGTRPPSWETPVHEPAFLSGLWDYGENLVGITNQVSVADIDPAKPGPEIVFAGFDGKLHAVSAAGERLWSRTYTTSAEEWTAGVAIADLSGDGIPELVMNTYGTGGGDLIILNAAGEILHRVPLGGRGAMPVPTIADADNDGDLDITVSLKDAVDREQAVLIYEVPGSATNCLLWATGRGNYRRDGYLPID
ncbi:MAG: hypothetical protein SFX73_20250 [Kofleriaceae bacterium]|nr:hypothetical protein [Kofleriaceae bacterium]